VRADYEALKNNRDLKMAALKVEEARAQFNVTDADRYPQLNASSGITLQRRAEK
jgi:Cu(I)/Ag(I) efflux system outer membrane protein